VSVQQPLLALDADGIEHDVAAVPQQLGVVHAMGGFAPDGASTMRQAGHAELTALRRNRAP
jgi:hypothetical protein